MSLILEALKKSDAERQRAAAGRQAAPAFGPSRGRKTIRRTLLLTACILGLAFGGYAWRQSSETRVPTEPVATLPTPQPLEIAAAAPAQPATSAPEPELVTEEKGMPAQAANETIAAVARSVAPPVEPGQPESASAIEESILVESIPPQEPLLVDLDLPALRPLVNAPDAVVASTPVGDGRMATFSQLPTALQSEIGDLTLNVLVFAEQAADRFVLINLRRYQGGEQVKDRLVVAEIRADGVVLDYDGRRFLLDTRF